MREFYDFISSIKYNNDNVKNDTNSIIIEFSYFIGLEEILNFNKLKKLTNMYPNVVNLYIYSSITNEINLMNFLDDESEFNSEVFNNEITKNKYKIFINSKEVMENLFKNENDEINALVFLNNDIFFNAIDFEPQDYIKIEKNFYSRNKNIIIVIDSKIFLCNPCCLIIGLNRDDSINKIKEFLQSTDNKAINEVCQLRNISCNWVESTNYLNPNHTFFDKDKFDFSIDENIFNKLIEITVNLTMLSISNFSGKVEGEFKSIINGNKRIELEYSNSDIYQYEGCKNLYTIYNWIYERPSIEKLNICRNVICALITAKCQGNFLNIIVENSELLLTSLNDNLESYTKENVSNFFENKNIKKKELLNNIKIITDQIDFIIKLMVNNMTSLIAVSIAGVIAYISKGSIIVVKILEVLYLLQFDITLFLNLPINYVNYKNTNLDFENIKNEYEKLYFRDNDISKYEKKMKKTRKMLIIYFTVIVIMFVLINFIGIKMIISNSFSDWILKKLQ